jgi:hypothetical protein
MILQRWSAVAGPAPVERRRLDPEDRGYLPIA